MEAQRHPGNPELERRLDELRRQRGDLVSITEVDEVVESLLATMRGDLTAWHLRLYKELEDLTRYIERARSDIADLHPVEIQREHLPAATDQLDAIVKATEEATSTILDSAERIETEVGASGNPAIRQAVTRIFEACSFQDLTGQRIGKVVNTLKYIEERLDQLGQAFGDEIKKSKRPQAKKNEAPSEREMLQGPQLEDAGISQAAIDALFASLD